MAATSDRERIAATLRNFEGDYHYPPGLLSDAADEIESLRDRIGALERELSQEREISNNLSTRTHTLTLRAEEAASALLSLQRAVRSTIEAIVKHNNDPQQVDPDIDERCRYDFIGTLMKLQAALLPDPAGTTPT